MNAFYLIGERLGHSFSAAIHRCFGRYDYELKELHPAELGPFLKSRAFSGLNVTVPYKQAVIPYLDRLDPEAAAAGSVNTVVNRNGVLWGYNTDLGGMAAALRCAIIDPAGKRVQILGTGGTSKTALAVCRALGAAEVRRVSRTGREGAATYEQAAAAAAELLFNTTPVGMFPDQEAMPLDPADLPALEAVFDCVYNPLRTRLVLAARSRGIPAEGGLRMLVEQAARSCALFTGRPVESSEVIKIYNNLLHSAENLVLIGMPGAGKTTVGRLLAQMTGRDFIDLDEEIVRRTGKPISALFAEDGEARFRDLESDLIRELAPVGGRIIATGGGAIGRAENRIRLRQNGRLFFLDPPPEALRPTPDRPLGDTAEKLRRLYEQRRPLYIAAADHTIPDRPTPEQAARRILELA